MPDRVLFKLRELEVGAGRVELRVDDGGEQGGALSQVSAGVQRRGRGLDTAGRHGHGSHEARRVDVAGADSLAGWQESTRAGDGER